METRGTLPLDRFFYTMDVLTPPAKKGGGVGYWYKQGGILIYVNEHQTTSNTGCKSQGEYM